MLAVLPAAAPEVLGPPDLTLHFGAWQLHEMRAEVQQALVDAGCELDHAEDVVLAVNEVATNAVEHGSSEAELYLWTGGELVCEVHDRGVLADPLPGLQAPHPPTRGVAGSGSPVSSATCCTSGPTRAAPTCACRPLVSKMRTHNVTPLAAASPDL